MGPGDDNDHGLWEAYSEESYAVFSEAFIKHDKTPTGVDIDMLKNDIEILQKREKRALSPLNNRIRFQ